MISQGRINNTWQLNIPVAVDVQIKAYGSISSPAALNKGLKHLSRATPSSVTRLPKLGTCATSA